MFPPGADQDAAWQWGYLTGLWHDLGKFAPDWQRYLSSKSDLHEAEISERLDHATAGAVHAVSTGNPLGHLLAFAIAGHHSGLLDAISENACLEKRLNKTIPDYSNAPAELLKRPIPALPPSIAADLRRPFTGAFFTRMLFSALVDADFLATEAFMSPAQAALRSNETGSVLPAMLQLLDQKLASFPVPTGIVDECRKTVHQACIRAAKERKGLFSLTVPTGGGKTLASLRVSDDHTRHSDDRITRLEDHPHRSDDRIPLFQDPPQIQDDHTSTLEDHPHMHGDRIPLLEDYPHTQDDHAAVLADQTQFLEDRATHLKDHPSI